MFKSVFFLVICVAVMLTTMLGVSSQNNYTNQEQLLGENVVIEQEEAKNIGVGNIGNFLDLRGIFNTIEVNQEAESNSASGEEYANAANIAIFSFLSGGPRKMLQIGHQ